MFCPKCGKELQKGSVFCGACGNRINMPEDQVQVSSDDNTDVRTKKFSTKSLIIYGILFLAAAAVIAFFLIKFINSDDSQNLYKDNMLPVLDFDGNSYIIDKNGNTVIDGYVCIISEKSDLIRISNDNGKFGYMNKKGKVVINPQFDFAAMFDESGMAAVQLGDKMGYIDKTGKYVINPQFDMAYSFGSSKYAAVSSGGKFGYIDRKGKYVINPQFDSAENFIDNKIALVGSGGKYGYIDQNGKYIVNPHFDKAYDFASNGLARVCVNYQYGFIDTKGNYVINPQFDYASDFDCMGYAVVSVNGSYGYIDKTGKYVINPQFNDAKSFAENGLAAVSMNGLYGYINKKGEFEINPQYRYAYNFSKCGIARINDNDTYYYIDKKGNMTSPQKYDYASDYYSDGYAIVFDSSAHIIDKKGNECPTGPAQLESVVSFDSDLINRLFDIINSMDFDNIDDTDYYFDAESYFLDKYGEALAEEMTNISDVQFYCSLKYSEANINAKLVYTNTATLITKYQNDGISLADGMYYNATNDFTEKLEFSKGNNDEFANNMMFLTADSNSDSKYDGYFAVYIKDNLPVRAFWSKDSRLIEKAKKKILSDDENFGCIVGGYPQELSPQ